MRNRHFGKILISAILGLTLLNCTFSIAAYYCGEPLYTWKGVTAYHNGAYQAGADPDSHDKIWTCGECNDFGWSYQCVQYVNKFYHAAGMRKSINSGDANQYFANAGSRGLASHSNHSSEIPRVNDILCFEGGYGHVAIVTDVILVAENEHRVYMAEQNWSDNGTAVLAMHYDPDTQIYDVDKRGNYKVQGWLRIPYLCKLYSQSPATTKIVHPGEVVNFAVYFTNQLTPRATSLLDHLGSLDWKNGSLQGENMSSKDIQGFKMSSEYFHYVELRSCDKDGCPTKNWLYPGDDIWVSNDRIRVVAQSAFNVGYNQNAGFLFTGKIPDDAAPGVYKIYFRPYHATAGYIDGWDEMHFTLVVGDEAISPGQGADSEVFALFVNTYSGNNELLGNPVSEVIETRSGFDTDGCYQRFANGSIQVHSGNAYLVVDKIFKEWGEHGYANWAGFPVSNRYEISGKIRQDFEGGYIQIDGDAATFISTTHPVNLTAEIRSAGLAERTEVEKSVILHWENRVNAAGITLYLGENSMEKIAVLEPGTNSYIYTRAESGKEYTFFAQAYNQTAVSPLSNPATVHSDPIITPLSGNVTDISSAKPIASAAVSTNTGAVVQTAPDGVYHFDTLAAGVYDITFSKTNYQSATIENVVVYPGKSNQLDVMLTTPGLLNIVTTQLSFAETDKEYNSRVRIDGGTWPYTFSTSSGPLPPGMTLDREYGNISGTPTASGLYTFTISVRDYLNNYASKSFTIEVADALSLVSDVYLPETLMDAIYAFSFAAAGGCKPYTFSATDDLPIDLFLTSTGDLVNKVSNTFDFNTENLHQKWKLYGGVSLQSNTLYFDDSVSTSTAEITVNCTSGTLSYTRAADNGYFDSSFNFYIDGIRKEHLNFQYSRPEIFSVDIAEGTHTFKWVLAIDPGETNSGNYAWIDNLYIPQDQEGELYFTVTVADNSGRSAQKQFILPVANPLLIATSRLDDGIVGETYNQTLTASGGYGSYTWDIFSGVLPHGLHFDNASGILTGVPTEETYGTIVFSVTDESGGITYQDFTLQIADPIKIVTENMPDGLTNSFYSEAVRVEGGIAPFTFSCTGQLPDGLVLDRATGIISGTPEIAGDTNAAILVTDSTQPVAQNATQNLSFFVSADLTVTTSAILPNEKINHSITTVLFAAGGSTPPYTWKVVDGYLPDGIMLDSNQGKLSGTPVDQGDFIFTVEVTDSSTKTAKTAQKNFFWHISGDLSIVTGSIPDGAIAENYNFNLTATGGLAPYTWRMKSGTLPDGLKFNGSTGVISGNPSSRQTYSFTVEVRDHDAPAQSEEKTYVIDILDELFIKTPSLANGRKDESYYAPITASLGDPPYLWRLESGILPPGLTLSATSRSAILQGTPTTPGNYTFIIEISDSGTPIKHNYREFSITIYDDLTFGSTTLFSAIRGTEYSDFIIATGGKRPYHWSLSSGSLPAGLNINSTTGYITGTSDITAGESSEFTVAVTDSGNPVSTITQQFVIYVTNPLTITTNSIQNSLINIPCTVEFAGDGGVSPYIWEISSGRLPSGLELDSTSGVLTGTPREAGNFSFSIKINDSAPRPATTVKTFALNVLGNSISVTPTALHFVTIEGGAGKSLDLTVHNSGDTDLQLLSVSLSGTNDTSFSLEANSCIGHTLAVGEDCTITVIFSATRSGSYEAVLSINSDDPDIFVLVDLTGVVRPFSESYDTVFICGAYNCNCGDNFPCYNKVDDGYAVVSDKGTIKLGADFYLEDLIFTEPVAITLSGGWNSDFSDNSEGESVISGSIIVTRGTVIVDRIVAGGTN